MTCHTGKRQSPGQRREPVLSDSGNTKEWAANRAGANRAGALCPTGTESSEDSLVVAVLLLFSRLDVENETKRQGCSFWQDSQLELSRRPIAKVPSSDFAILKSI